jgi:hypothetical protein
VNWQDRLSDMTPAEMALAILLMCGMALAITAVVSFLLRFFVALKSPPSLRAAWISGLSYLAASAILYFGGPPGIGVLAPLSCIPAALIVYLVRWRDFRQRWVDSPELAPAAVDLETDDWKRGLGLLASLLAAPILGALLRHFL